MRRRLFVAALLAALAVAPAARTEDATRTYRVGLLTPAPEQWDAEAFRDALRKAGYIEGRNLTLDVRSAEGRLDRLPALAKSLAATRPDLIVAVNTPGTRAAIDATRSIPIVMAVVGDPVGMHFVESLAHPGGNVTGVSNLSGELAGKRLSVLREVVPAARRLAILLNPNDPVTVRQVSDARHVAPSMGFEVRFFPVSRAEELADVFDQVTGWRADAAMWLTGQQSKMEARTIALAAQAKLPVMYVWGHFVKAGGLVSYFTDRPQLFRRAALYVDRILKGERPANLPVEQPTKFELTLNLKTAKALGLALPPSLIAAADVVVE